MNILPHEKRVKILQLLVEGNSLRSCSRIVDVSINTVSKLLLQAGEACIGYHNRIVKDLKCERVQCDEIWSFVYSKQKNTPPEAIDMGDVWTWVAMDADTKLIIAWYVGKRDQEASSIFMHDVAARIKTRVQLTSDGHYAYRDAVDDAFKLQVDFAMLEKQYGVSDRPHPVTGKVTKATRYLGAIKKIRSGNPNLKFVSTSYIERQNLNMRMGMRRFTRETNGFSKKMENHCCAIALHFMYNNFIRIHTSLRVTPAMQSGLLKKPLKLDNILEMIPSN